MEAGVRADFGGEALGPPGGAVDFDERPQRLTAVLTAGTAAAVVEQGVGDDGLTSTEGAVDFGVPVQRLAYVPMPAGVLDERQPGLRHRQGVLTRIFDIGQGGSTPYVLCISTE